MKIPILTYHSLHAPGNDYASNDHIALQADLELIRDLGLTPISLDSIADWLDPEHAFSPADGAYVAISFDDGCDHDFHNFCFPGIPDLISFYNLIKTNNASYCELHPITATSFVIASPLARTMLDKTCIAGRNQWRDCWWQQADQSGLLIIGNHSWDHTHPELDFVAQHANETGNFRCVDNQTDADLQILQAQWYIWQKLGHRQPALFAYPYGDCNNYLINHYFPAQQAHFRAAFSTGGDYVTEQTNRWSIPRFVCGEHWHSVDQLERILCDHSSSALFDSMQYSDPTGR